MICIHYVIWYYTTDIPDLFGHPMIKKKKLSLRKQLNYFTRDGPEKIDNISIQHIVIQFIDCSNLSDE